MLLTLKYIEDCRNVTLNSEVVDFNFFFFRLRIFLWLPDVVFHSAEKKKHIATHSILYNLFLYDMPKGFSMIILQSILRQCISIRSIARSTDKFVKKQQYRLQRSRSSKHDLISDSILFSCRCFRGCHSLQDGWNYSWNEMSRRSIYPWNRFS